MRNAALLPVLIFLLSGCGALMMRSPKSDNPAESPRCSESRGGVVLDGLFASTYALGSFLALSEDEGDFALLSAALGAVHVASAVVGHRSASRCTKAHEAHQAWIEGKAPRQLPRLPDEDHETPMGMAGSACYPNMSCNAGLRCDPDRKQCVKAETAAETTADMPSAEATKPSETTGSQPANPSTTTNSSTTQTAQPDPRAGRPADSSTLRPRREPASRRVPDSDEPWGDFWREVNP